MQRPQDLSAPLLQLVLTELNCQKDHEDVDEEQEFEDFFEENVIEDDDDDEEDDDMA